MIGVTVAAVMVETSRLKWDPYFDADEVEAMGQLAIERDMELVLTTWPAPQVKVIDAMLDDMRGFLMSGAVAWEVDVEGQWKAKHVRGFDSLAAAEHYLYLQMRKMALPSDVRLELTTHTGHRECGPRARLTPRVDRFLPQLYSCRHRPGGKLVAWNDGRLGPGRLQRHYGARLPEHGKLCVGLPAWDQQWPGHEVEEAMQLALDAAIELDPVEIRYWSSKHLWRRRNAQIAGFIAQRWGV